MKIWLIRHGMTVPGEEGRYQGFLDESLSEKGRTALARAPFSPSHVYVSPAKRARETASILFLDPLSRRRTDLYPRTVGNEFRCF